MIAGEFVVKLAADVNSLQRDLDKASSVVTGFQRNVSSSVSSITSAFKGIAVVGGLMAAGDAFAGMAKGVVDLGDQLRDMSRYTGQSVEQLSFLDYAAKQSGTSIESLNTTFAKYSKAISGAVLGTNKDAAASFRQLGLDAQELSKSSFADQLGAVGDALAKIENPLERATLGQTLFGKTFKENASLILEGSAGLKTLAKDFDQLGGVITKEQADKFDALNDSFGNLALASKNLAKSLISDLAPALTEVANGLAKAFSPPKEIDATAVKIKNLFDRIQERRDQLAAGTVDPNNKVWWLPNFKLSDDQTKVLEKDLASLRAELKATSTEWMTLNKSAKGESVLSSVNAPTGDIDTSNVKVEKDQQAIDQVLYYFKEAEKTKKELIQDTDDVQQYFYQQSMERAREEQKAATDFYKERSKLIMDLMTPEEKYAAQVKKLLEYDLDSTNLNRGIDAAAKTLQDTYDKADKANKIGHELGLTFTSAFEDAIVGGKAFSEVLKGIAQDILRMIARKMITDPLGDALSGFLGGFMKSGFSGLASSVSGSVSSFTNYALGGFGNATGGLYKVAGGNQEHPISFTAKAGEIVAVGTKMTSGGNGGGVVVNIQNYSGEKASSKETTDSRGNRRVEVTIGDMVAGEIARHGSSANKSIRGAFGTSPALVGR